MKVMMWGYSIMAGIQTKVLHLFQSNFQFQFSFPLKTFSGVSILIRHFSDCSVEVQSFPQENFCDKKHLVLIFGKPYPRWVYPFYRAFSTHRWANYQSVLEFELSRSQF